MCQGVLKYCLLNLLGKQQEETLSFFFDTITALLDESHKKDNLTKLRDDLNTALAMLERDSPVSVQVIVSRCKNQFRKYNNRTSLHICCIILWMELKDSDQCTLHGCTHMNALMAGLAEEL